MAKPGEDANTKQQEKQKKLFVKILISVLIVAVITGIYFFKNSEKAASDTVDYISPEFDLDATEDFDLKKIRSYGLPVLIDFGADSCIPCKEMAPILKELNQELRGKAIVKFVDVWKNPDASKDIPLKTIPTQFFFDKNGRAYVPQLSAIKFKKHYSQEAENEILFAAHEGGLDKDQILAVFEEMGIK